MGTCFPWCSQIIHVNNTCFLCCGELIFLNQKPQMGHLRQRECGCVTKMSQNVMKSDTQSQRLLSTRYPNSVCFNDWHFSPGRQARTGCYLKITASRFVSPSFLLSFSIFFNQHAYCDPECQMYKIRQQRKQDEHQLSLLHERQSTNATEEKRFPSINTKFFQSKEETPSNLRTVYIECLVLL